MKRTIAILLTVLLALCAMPVGAETAFDIESYLDARVQWIGSEAADQDLTDEEWAVERLLLYMKSDADVLYTERSTGYGLVTAGHPEAAQSELYAFCKALPKGGELHIHDYTAIPFDTFVDILVNYEGGDVSVCLDEGTKYCYLYAPGVEADVETVPLKKALEDGYLTRKQLRQALSIEPGLTPRQAWDSFQPFFRKIGGLSTDYALMEQLYDAALRSCIENGLTLVEIRLRMGPDSEANRELVNLVKRAYFSIKAENPDFTVRLICTSGKSVKSTVESSEDMLRTAIQMSREVVDDFDPENPRPFIIGLDMVNEEDMSHPLSEYAEFFMSDEVQSSGLQLFMHCGESLRLDNEAVVDAYMFGACRMGHGYNLYRYPKLMKAAAEKGVAVEACPVSNCLLGYATDLRLHPAQNYLRNGIPVALCSDDGLFLEDAPLTEDFFAATLSWNLTLGEIKTLAENSILYSGLPEDEVNALHDAWQKQWDAFIAEWSETAKQKTALY